MLAGLADHIPASQRGKVSGIAGVCNYSSLALAAYVAGWFSSSTALMFIAPAVIGLLLMLAFAPLLRAERPTEPAPGLAAALFALAGPVSCTALYLAAGGAAVLGGVAVLAVRGSR